MSGLRQNRCQFCKMPQEIKKEFLNEDLTITNLDRKQQIILDRLRILHIRFILFIYIYN